MVPCADGGASTAVADGGGGALADAGAGRERIQANSEEYASSICEGICVPAIADPHDTVALPGTTLSAVVHFERQSCAAEGRGIPVPAEVLSVRSAAAAPAVSAGTLPADTVTGEPSAGCDAAVALRDWDSSCMRSLSFGFCWQGQETSQNLKPSWVHWT